jgi:hypothetical protein
MCQLFAVRVEEQPITATDQRRPSLLFGSPSYRQPRISAQNEIWFADKFVGETAKTAGTGMRPVFGRP